MVDSLSRTHVSAKEARGSIPLRSTLSFLKIGTKEPILSEF